MGKKSRDEEEVFEVVERSEMIALKDFHIFQPPEIDIKITKGDDLSEIPERFLINLITENVLKGK